MPDSEKKKQIAKKTNKPAIQKKKKTKNVLKVLSVTSKTKGIDIDRILFDLMQYTSIGDELSNIEKTTKYVVQIPLKYQDAFNKGEVFLNQSSKTGITYPTLYHYVNGKRQFACNLPIKEEEMVNGYSFDNMAIQYQNLYLQRQIKELSQMMEKTYKAVERIEHGQMDDRIGRLHAGRDQILLSFNLDPKDRKHEIGLGRQNLLTAQKQILATLKRRIQEFEAIPDNELQRLWLELTNSGYFREKDKEYDEIQEYFSLYLQATQMLAASYVICGELSAAENVFAIAEKDVKDINFRSLKTLDNIHKNTSNLLYNHAVDFIKTERKICMEEAKNYDVMRVTVSGRKLLEVSKNVREKEQEI